MTLIEALNASPALLLITTTLLGLCVGSFLNVVAYRLPLMIEQEFRDACRESFQAPPADPHEQRVSLLRPGSHCPHCKARIRPWHNLPVVGWLLLRGRCAHCSAPISAQYPVVEALTGLLSLVCAWRFGFTPQLGGALTVTWFLVALTVTDIKTMYLPDQLTLPMLWLGLLASLLPVFAPTQAAIIGAAAGYLALWSVYWLFRLATGKEGMGYGDFKLLAALGAWLGWAVLPQIVLLSAFVGAAVGLGLILARRSQWTAKLPFGPYLAGAGWIAMVFGQAINAAYLDLAGLR
jgi:leader peptidase (prepilin peptidase)/N-methyltransferase